LPSSSVSIAKGCGQLAQLEKSTGDSKPVAPKREPLKAIAVPAHKGSCISLRDMTGTVESDQGQSLRMMATASQKQVLIATIVR
jgi:hypothetical protein